MSLTRLAASPRGPSTPASDPCLDTQPGPCFPPTSPLSLSLSLSPPSQIQREHAQAPHTAGEVLRSHGLLHSGIWTQLRASALQPTYSQPLAFLKLIAEGIGYQSAAQAQEPEIEGTARKWLPGQEM